jgi:hypothetical protein
MREFSYQHISNCSTRTILQTFLHLFTELLAIEAAKLMHVYPLRVEIFGCQIILVKRLLILLLLKRTEVTRGEAPAKFKTKNY